jgi:sugar/nucleoside kinase (ribokinase family)
MTREEIARSAAARLEEALARPGIPPVLIGFDGFIDSILDAVDYRRDMSPAGYQPIATIGQLAGRIGAAAGKSMNLEIVPREERWGGNGPLLAGALGRLGVPVTYIGAVGQAEDPTRLHSAYRELAQRCRRIIPVAAPGHTYALEFQDGKVMLNEPRSVQEVTWERVLERAGGIDTLLELLRPVHLLGIVNWSLLGGVDGICRGLIEHLLPRLDDDIPRRIFIDLSDPAKRSDEDLRGVLGLLAQMSSFVPVTLGLNLAEAERVADVLSAAVFDAERELEGLQRAAGALREATGLACIVIHRRHGAAAASACESACFAGPFTARPRISTGAGDHFNGGFALAQMLEMPLAECLALGCAVAGLYIRAAQAPPPRPLIDFLRSLPQPDRVGD